MDITAKYQHSKLGNFMFNLCANWAKFLVKHKILYYILACTWGSVLTLAGLIVSGILFIAKLFIKNISFNKYNWIYYIKVGPVYWGGLEFGLNFLRDQRSVESLNEHEYGHTFQNCLFGPLYIFLIGIPSTLRYWIRTLLEALGKKLPPYDNVWFEDAASQIGKYASKYLVAKY